MKASFVRLALATTMMMPFAPAMAADIDLPPVRPSIVSLGVIGATTALEGGYETTFCGCVNTQDMSGIDYGLGVKAGWDYYGEGGWAVGIVGDWMWGLGELAEQDNPAESTYLDMNYLATLRARAGWAADNTLLYVTGGFAAAEMEFGGLVGPVAPYVNDSDTQWTYGWTIGGGIEYAVTDNFSVGLEYLYIALDDTSHTLSDDLGTVGKLDMEYDDMHTVRLGFAYRFGL
jgi:outer membrane immunogenic protein